MPEETTIDRTPDPLTRPLLVKQFTALGVRPGQTILMHSALSQLGWVVGGPVTVIQALLEILGDDGTLMVPTHSSNNSEPSLWQNPPVPESWWAIIREHMPAFDPQITPTRQMGIISDTLRCWDGARRSNHPHDSFTAVGKHKTTLVGGYTELGDCLGETSPLARLYDLNGWVLLLGVGHGNNTSLHLCEARANYPNKQYERNGAAVFVDGERQWVAFDQIAWDDEDFETLGAAYEAQQGGAYTIGQIGNATARLLHQPPMVDFGVKWMEAHRGKN